MEEIRARHVVDTLRGRGIDAHLAKAGVYQFGVRVVLVPTGISLAESLWDDEAEDAGEGDEG